MKSFIADFHYRIFSSDESIKLPLKLRLMARPEVFLPFPPVLKGILPARQSNYTC